MILRKILFFSFFILLSKVVWGQGVIQNYSDSIVSDSTKQLNSVNIYGKRKIFERKIDRYVFNVENSINTTGTDAFEVLKLTPGVTVQENIIKITGKSTVIVLIDDRTIPLSGDELISFLRTIPSSNIRSIEVITTPPSKYDASGNSGIIRIVLKKIKKNTWNLNSLFSLQQQTFSNSDLGLNFTYQKNKISFFLSINSGLGSKLLSFDNNIFYTNQSWNTHSPMKVTNNYLSTRLGFDYEVNSKWNLGLSYLGDFSKVIMDSKNKYSIFDNNHNPDKYIYSFGLVNENPLITPINIHSIHKLDTLGKKLSFDFDFFNLISKKDGQFQGNNYDSNFIIIENTNFINGNINNQNVSNYSGKFDFELPFNKINVSFGGKVTNTQTNNKLNYFKDNIEDLSKSNHFVYKENIQALYLSGYKKINVKLDVQIGLRLENTIKSGYSENLNQLNKSTYINLFPSVYTTYTYKEDKTISLTYSRRINRPYFEMLNPFKFYMSPYNFIEGNPFLKPSYANNFEFIVNTSNYEFKVFYDNLNQDFSQLGIIDTATYVIRYGYLNYLNSNSIGISNMYTFNKERVNSVNTLYLYYTNSISTSNITNHSLSGLNAYVSSSNNFVLNKNKTMFFNLTCSYYFPSIVGISKSSGYGGLSLAIRSKLLHDKVNISLVASDIFRTELPLVTSYSNSVRQEYKNYYDNRNIRVSIFYNIGNKEINVEPRSFGNEEEKSRTGK